MENKAECICDDPFRTGQCPVHPVEIPGGYPNQPTEKVVIVSPADRIEPTKHTTWTGYLFKCTGCNEESIMHFGSFSMNFCPACGSRVIYSWENKAVAKNAPTANASPTTEGAEPPP